MKSKVLVTGAAGFLGSHVVDHCLAQGFQVIAVDNLSGGYRENVPAGSIFIEGDLTEKAFIEKIFNEHDFEYVYHLGAYAAEGLSHFIRHYNYQINLLASILLINASVNRGVKHFVFTSSIAVYGPGQTPMSEETTPHPEDPYGVSKYAVELDLEAAHKMFGLNYTIFRPHNVYGERQNIADKYRNVIGIFMNQIMQGKPMSIFGDGLQTRAFSYIDDVAPYIAQAPVIPAAKNKIFNIGADTPYTILELAQAVASSFGVTAEICHLESRNEVTHAYCTHDKLHHAFGKSVPTDLNSGLSKMATWVKARGAIAPVSYTNIEIRKNLPRSWQS
jgi:UDP-glucose 4-epimerase